MVGPRVNGPPLGRAPAIQIPAFRAAGADPGAWIKPTGTLAFRTSAQTTDVTLVPLNRIFAKRYSVYWQVT
jgi:hypothetical protein